MFRVLPKKCDFTVYPEFLRKNTKCAHPKLDFFFRVFPFFSNNHVLFRHGRSDGSKEILYFQTLKLFLAQTTTNQNPFSELDPFLTFMNLFTALRGPQPNTFLLKFVSFFPSIQVFFEAESEFGWRFSRKIPFFGDFFSEFPLEISRKIALLG